MRVRFVLRKNRLNKLGKAPLDCRVRVHGVQATPFSTMIMLAPSSWDAASQRVKGNSDLSNQVNTTLSEIKAKFSQIINFATAKGKRLSAKQLVDIYHGKREFSCTFDVLCQKKIEDLKENCRSEETIKIHERAHRAMRDYLGENLPVENIDRETVSGFWSWFKKRGRSDERPTGYSVDYVNKTITNLRGLFLFAIDGGYLENMPFKGRLKWENKEDTDCPTDEEIEKILSMEWSPVHQKVIDSWLFMSYQGFHISDYKKVSENNLTTYRGRKFIKMGRTKNNSPILVPLHKEAERIIEKYGGIEKLPKKSGQRNNDHLSIIAAKAGVKSEFTNIRARKKFTDRCLNTYGISIETVAAMLGHKSTKWVKKYAKVKEERMIREIEGTEF